MPRGIVIYDRIRAGIERRAIERGDVRILAITRAPRSPKDMDQGPHEGMIVGPLPESFARARPVKPVLAVARGSESVKLPAVLSDNSAVGRLAARHLCESGARFLAAVDWIPKPFARERLAAFEAEARSLGVPCRVTWLNPNRSPFAADYLKWERELEKGVRSFLHGLPDHAGIFAPTDDRAIAVWAAARSCGKRIPEDFLLLGVDDVESGGLLPFQGLSSVALDCVTMGRRALDRLVEAVMGQTPIRGDELVPPLGVVARHSTESFPHEDPLIERALRRIRSGEHPEDTAETLAVALGVSRVTLWRRFEAALRRSPAELLREARMEQARRLLRETRLSVREIARRCGFYHASAFARAFRRIEGLPPDEWRRHRA